MLNIRRSIHKLNKKSTFLQKKICDFKLRPNLVVVPAKRLDPDDPLFLSSFFSYEITFLAPSSQICLESSKKERVVEKRFL